MQILDSFDETQNFIFRGLCNNQPMIASSHARVKRSLEKRPRARDFGVYCVETMTGRLKTEEKKK